MKINNQIKKKELANKLFNLFYKEKLAGANVSFFIYPHDIIDINFWEGNKIKYYIWIDMEDINNMRKIIKKWANKGVNEVRVIRRVK